MAFESGADDGFRRLQQSWGKDVLIGRLYREVRMLRRHLEGRAFADAACPICFRTYPHSEDIHIEERLKLNQIEPLEVSGYGYNNTKSELYRHEQQDRQTEEESNG